MDDEKKYSEYEFHHKLAIELNGLVWSLLEKPHRTDAENDIMIHAAHTSHFHWSKVGTEINLQRGHWLISRVYAVLNRPESSLYHANKCLSLTIQHDFTGFDLAYAYEAIARANASNGNDLEWEKYFHLAKNAADNIDTKEDRDLFISDLLSEPWFDMKK
jgi:hypothetical protein